MQNEQSIDQQNGQPVEIEIPAAPATTAAPWSEPVEPIPPRNLPREIGLGEAKLLGLTETFVREVRLAKVLGERGETAALELEQQCSALFALIHEALNA